GVFELQRVIGQLLLGLADAGLGLLPEIRCAVHYENQRLLVRGLGAGAERQRQPGHGGEPREIMDLHAFPPVRLVEDAGRAGSILILNYHMNESRERQHSTAGRAAVGAGWRPAGAGVRPAASPSCAWS